MNKSGWGEETLRCAALQYANGQVKVPMFKIGSVG